MASENETKEVMKADTGIMARGEYNPEDVKKQIDKIQVLMKSVMQSGQHFGVIPGTEKPTLLKPGAEKLNFMFRHIPRFERERIDHQNGHREYISRCSLYKFGTDDLVGQGEGSCSTMESKYRYRNISDYEDTGLPIPSDSKERKAEYRKQGFGMKKVNGVWLWVKYKDSEKVENPDIADTYNTVLKMADKRSLVAATINACAASDIFTQDMEDFGDMDGGEEPRNVSPRQGKPAQNNNSTVAKTLFDMTDWTGQEPKKQYVSNLLAEGKNSEAERLISTWSLPKVAKPDAELDNTPF